MKFLKGRSQLGEVGWFGATLPAQPMMWCPGELRASGFVCSKCNVSRMLIWAPPRPHPD